MTTEKVETVLRFMEGLRSNLPEIESAKTPAEAARQAYANAILLVRAGLLNQEQIT